MQAGPSTAESNIREEIAASWGCSNQDQLLVAITAHQGMAAPSVPSLWTCRGLWEPVAPTLWHDKISGLKTKEFFQRTQHVEVGSHGLTKSSPSHWAAQQEVITKWETSAGSERPSCSLSSKWSLPGLTIFHFLPVSPACL